MTSPSRASAEKLLKQLECGYVERGDVAAQVVRDLLALLSEGEQKHEQEKNVTRMDTMGDSTDSRTAPTDLPTAVCPECGGSGQVPVCERHVTADMASDAGEPAMEGMSLGMEFGECEMCGGCGVVVRDSPAVDAVGARDASAPTVAPASCADCGAPMNEGEAKCFTVCDSCWDAHVASRRDAQAKQHPKSSLTEMEAEIQRLQASGRCLNCSADIHDGSASCASCAASEALRSTGYRSRAENAEAKLVETVFSMEQAGFPVSDYDPDEAIDQLSTRLKQAEASLTRVTQERDEEIVSRICVAANLDPDAIPFVEGTGVVEHLAALVAFTIAERAEAQVSRLTQALEKLKPYVQHDYGCQMRSSTAEYERTGAMPDCTCGLAALLPPPAVKPEEDLSRGRTRT